MKIFANPTAITNGDVLVVEDDFQLSELIKDILEENGYRVRQALNGLVAFNLLIEGYKPKLILLDLFMPVVDGWQFLDMMRHHYNGQFSIPIVIVSAAGSLADQTAHQVQGYLKKPVSLADLLKKVSEFCGPHTVNFRGDV